jgi:hypothetical protein
MNHYPYESQPIPAESQSPSTSAKKPNPWAGLVAGIGVIFLGFCAFGYFTEFEKGNRKPETMPALIVVPYQLFGKWVASYVTISFGAIAVAGSLHAIIKGRKRSDGR